MSCERCKDWSEMGLSSTCPSCDLAEENKHDTRKPQEFKFTVYEEPNGVSVVWDGHTMPTIPGEYHVVEYSTLSMEADAHIQTAGTLQTKINALEKERDTWKWEYENLCKFANDLEGKIEALRKELKITQMDREQVGFVMEELRKERDELKEQAYIDAERADKAEKERDDLHARLSQRHIIGKAYEVTRETVNQLAGELDRTKEERDAQISINSALNIVGRQIMAEAQEYRAALEKHDCHNDNLWDIDDGYPCETCELLAKHPKESN